MQTRRNAIECGRCSAVVVAASGLVTWCACPVIGHRVGIDGQESVRWRRVHFGQAQYVELGLGPVPVVLRQYRGRKSLPSDTDGA